MHFVAISCIVLATLLRFSRAQNGPTQYLIRTVPSAYVNNDDDDSDDNNASPYQPPAAPVSSSNAPYQAATPYQAKPNPTSCTTNYECTQLDPNAVCVMSSCQCAAKYVAVQLPAMTILVSRAALLATRYASQIYSPTSNANTVQCVPAFSVLQKSLTCLLERTCCQTAAERAAAAARPPSCQVVADPDTLKMFGGDVPKITFSLAPGTPSNITVNATTGAITADPLPTQPVTVKVQAKLATVPAQVSTATVTILPSQGAQCCDSPPLSKVTTITKSFDLIIQDFSALTSLQTPGLELLLDLSGKNIAVEGASLQDLFTIPCDKNITVTNVALLPNLVPDTATQVDICQYLDAPTAANGYQLTFKGGATDPLLFSAALFELYNNSPASGETFSCSFRVSVRSCNNLASTAVFTYNFPVAPFDDTTPRALPILDTEKKSKISKGKSRTSRTRKHSLEE